jgi:hypothetical protein
MWQLRILLFSLQPNLTIILPIQSTITGTPTALTVYLFVEESTKSRQAGCQFADPHDIDLVDASYITSGKPIGSTAASIDYGAETPGNPLRDPSRGFERGDQTAELKPLPQPHLKPLGCSRPSQTTWYSATKVHESASVQIMGIRKGGECPICLTDAA